MRLLQRVREIPVRKLVTLFLLLIFVGCDGSGDSRWWTRIPGYNDYWWQRGQPKSTAQLLEISRGKLIANLSAFSTARPDIAPDAEAIQTSLTSAYDVLSGVHSGGKKGDVSTQLAKTEERFIEIEAKLSIGSRPAYGELAGQLRVFSQKLRGGQDVSDEGFREAFGLYTSRVLAFLANELSVPAPVVS